MTVFAVWDEWRNPRSQRLALLALQPSLETAADPLRTICGPTDEKPYREWDESAALINARANVTLMSDDDVDELARERWDQRLRDHRDA